MHILITGGAGFGGSGLARALLKRGHEITVLDVVAPTHATNLQPVLSKIKYLWKSAQDVTQADLGGLDAVVHMVAQADVPMGFTSPRWTMEQCVNSALSILEAIKGLGPNNYPEKVIYASSGNVYGRPLYLPIDEQHPLTPHNPYAAAKAAAELYFWAYHRCYEIPSVVMANGAVIGPHMRREIFIYKWLWNILHGDPLMLEGGDQTRDVTYVDDVVDAWVKAIEAPTDKVVGEKFHVSYGEEHAVSEIMEWCIDISDSAPEIIYNPSRPGEEGQREYFTNQKAREVLGYNPKVPPKEGIERTWEWLKDMPRSAAD